MVSLPGGTGILAFTAKIEREVERTAGRCDCVARCGYILHPTSTSKRWHVGRHAEQEKGHAIEGERRSKDVDGFAGSEDGPPT